MLVGGHKYEIEVVVFPWSWDSVPTFTLWRKVNANPF